MTVLIVDINTKGVGNDVRIGITNCRKTEEEKRQPNGL